MTCRSTPDPRPRSPRVRVATAPVPCALTTALVVSLAAPGGCALLGPPPAPYSAKVAAPRNVPIHFADFDLTYLGERTVPVPVFALGSFVYNDFRVTHDAEAVKVCWTAGTGAIVPVSFTVADQEFLLERACAEQFGCSLKDNEVVITKMPRDPAQHDQISHHHGSDCSP
jgi:hypothetical protein